MNKIIEFNLNKIPSDNDRIPEIEELAKVGMPLSVEDAELLLESLAYTVREKIAEYAGVDMQDYSYSYKCDLAQSMIYYYLKGLNINAHPVNTNEVINGVCGHSLILVTINTTSGERLYLVDPSYIQFFSKENCNITKFIIIKNQVCVAPDPGFFVVNSSNTEKLLPLLRAGYIEFTEDIAKAYGDSFFQTKQGTSPEQIKYNVASGSNYIRWFKNFTSKISKTVEELQENDLLIESTCQSNKMSK